MSIAFSRSARSISKAMPKPPSSNRAAVGYPERYADCMLASTDWLARRLEDPGVVIVDARWRDDGSGRSLCERGHIPGAVYLDWSIPTAAGRSCSLLPTASPT